VKFTIWLAFYFYVALEIINIRLRLSLHHNICSFCCILQLKFQHNKFAAWHRALGIYYWASLYFEYHWSTALPLHQPAWSNYFLSILLLYSTNGKICKIIIHNLWELTAFWPAGVNNVISIWTKCCIQDTPAHISCLNCLEQFKLPFSSVIQSQITICRENSIQ
jgi:hypothetical protein